jgi:GNAT superfamily N-acetyltransferase
MKGSAGDRAARSGGRSRYPAEYQSAASFHGSGRIKFRPIKPSDAKRLQELFHSHSADTILHRYLAPIHDLPPELLREFVCLDYRRDMAIVGLAREAGRERMVCVGRYFREAGSREAEMAITVHDDFQKCGMGTFLLRWLMKIAREHGIEFFTADVLTDNHGMMRLLRKEAGKMESDTGAGVCHVRFRTSPRRRG